MSETTTLKEFIAARVERDVTANPEFHTIAQIRKHLDLQGDEVSEKTIQAQIGFPIQRLNAALGTVETLYPCVLIEVEKKDEGDQD